jgi:hypothetical protein
MHDDSEVLQRKLLKLLQDLIPNASMADAAAFSRELSEGEGFFSPDISNSPISQDASSVTSSHHGSETIPSQRESLFELGEIPAVQDRFYSLLKNRLQTEIQRNPPLFPWETEIHDYETEAVPYAATHAEATSVTAAGSQKVPVGLWTSQLKNLNLPVPMPEKILVQLFQRCQEVAQSSLLEGAKLVRIVEDLFPGHSQALNQLAGLVITSPARSGTTAAPASGANYPPSYETAVPPQQMVLSLLAAREIMTALTLSLSSRQPRVERQWMTEVGAMSIAAVYDFTSSMAKLRIEGKLPCRGSLRLLGNGLQATGDRLTAGDISVELNDVQPSQPYTLEVHLMEKDSNPLIFVIRIAED